MVLNNETDNRIESIDDAMLNLNLTPNSENDDEQEQEQEPILDCTNLYVKGLWKDCSQIQLDDLFHPYGVICQSRVYGNGIGFVRYETPQQAYAAIIALNNTKPHPRCPQPLAVQFAHKKFYKPKSVLNVGNEQIEMFVRTNTKNVYVRNLPKNNFTEMDFTLLCQPYGMINCIRLCNGFGFVRYFDESSAQNCIHCLHGKFLPYSKCPLVVKLANSDPFEPRIQFRPHNESHNESSTTKSTAAPSNTSNMNMSPNVLNNSPISMLPTNTVSPTFPAFAAATIGRSVSPMIPNLMNTPSNESFLISMNTNNNLPSSLPILNSDYSIGRSSNSANTTPVSAQSRNNLNTMVCVTPSPEKQIQPLTLSNGITPVLTAPPMSCYPINNHMNNCISIPIVPGLQSNLSN